MAWTEWQDAASEPNLVLIEATTGFSGSRTLQYEQQVIFAYGRTGNAAGTASINVTSSAAKVETLKSTGIDGGYSSLYARYAAFKITGNVGDSYNVSMSPSGDFSAIGIFGLDKG